MKNKYHKGSSGNIATVTIGDVTAVRETPKALLCHWGGDSIDHWVPKSLLDLASEVRAVGDRGRLVVPEWFAAKALSLGVEADR